MGIMMIYGHNYNYQEVIQNIKTGISYSPHNTGKGLNFCLVVNRAVSDDIQNENVVGKS